jgi:hypothetical protein
MSRGLILISVFIACAFVAGIVARNAMAGPVIAGVELNIASSAVEKADYWRRQARRDARFYRRHGYVPGMEPDVYGPAVDESVVVDEPDEPVVVDESIVDEQVVVGDEPVVDEPVVEEEAAVLVPLRPQSCGEFSYWDGADCVDARYYDPDLGPK